MEKTPASRFEEELELAKELATNDVMNYFHCGKGATFLLCLAQGIERLQQMVLAEEGVIFTYTYRDPK